MRLDTKKEKFFKIYKKNKIIKEICLMLQRKNCKQRPIHYPPTTSAFYEHHESFT